MMANHRNTVLYIGMTDDINRRAYEHRNHLIKGFTHRYNCEKLVWFEGHSSRVSAFTRERQLKKWKRQWKESLIEQVNPEWRDLAETLL
ncbi:GIY-YIG nuclease family protein [Ponticaulis sp.]|uniref:GIY-YIG nuclease family protein n=1 Tax=Ponticaulis sp. TaxID=2020902 RepID=UPI00345CE5C4